MKITTKDTTPPRTIKVHYPYVSLKVIFGFHNFDLDIKAFVKLNRLMKDEQGTLVISKADREDFISKIKNRIAKKFNGVFPKALKYYTIYFSKIEDKSTGHGTEYIEKWILSKSYNEKGQLIDCFS